MGIIPTIFICVILPLLIYFSLWLIITGIIGSLRMLLSKKWTRTSGKLISSEIKYKDLSDENHRHRKYVKIKTYVYKVNNEYFSSNQTLASDSLFSKEFKSLKKNMNKENTEKILNSLKSGKKIENIKGDLITVFYNPKKPQIACLENRFEKKIFIQIIMGLIFGTGLMYLSYYLLRNIIE
ncbi:DUF3592 domain-containing protein [Tenacibaculum geojense]|uniref:DUF3592 domain-containing protein n=1 Tax=Tenacibaculum geojense TaxID=915352 RepID=A0ABW3JTD6_9FLAO